MAYASTTGITDIFGAHNVTATGGWADMDGDGTGIAARVARMIVVADARVDDVLRATGYKIPAQNTAGNTPTTIEDLANRIAGLLLYQFTALDDLDDERMPGPLRAIKAEVDQIMQEIRSQKNRIDAIKGAQ